jgi:acetyl esterase/lipase
MGQLVAADARRFDCPPFSTSCSERDALATSVAEGLLRCAPAVCPTRYAEASPRQQVSADDVPMLLIGSTDELIATSQTTRMATALRAAGLPATTLLLRGTRHGADLRPYTDTAMLRWLDRYATSPGRGQ